MKALSLIAATLLFSSSVFAEVCTQEIIKETALSVGQQAGDQCQLSSLEKTNTGAYEAVLNCTSRTKKVRMTFKVVRDECVLSSFWVR